MSEKTGKPRGRPPGAKNKAKPVDLTFTKIKELFATCYTPGQQKKRFMQLKPSEQFRLMAMLEPKARPESEGAGTTVQLQLAGVPACRCNAPTMTCSNCGRVVERWDPTETPAKPVEVSPSVIGEDSTRNPFRHLKKGDECEAIKETREAKAAAPDPPPDPNTIRSVHDGIATLADGTTRQICDFEKWRGDSSWEKALKDFGVKEWDD